MKLMLNDKTQNPTVILVTKETNTQEEHLVEILQNRDHFVNWINRQDYGASELNDNILQFLQYGKATFSNGDIIRIKEYQLNSFEEE